MTDVASPDMDVPAKSSKKPILIGLVLALCLAAGGFYAVWSGMLFSDSDQEHAQNEETVEPGVLPDITFVPIQPIIINVGPSSATQYLRFQAQLEVWRGYEQDVTNLLPRIVDVLNGYLRAVETSDLERRSALVQMRGQMLRRIQVVTGEGRVRDLLIMEFVLN